MVPGTNGSVSVPADMHCGIASLLLRPLLVPRNWNTEILHWLVQNFFRRTFGERFNDQEPMSTEQQKNLLQDFNEK